MFLAYHPIDSCKCSSTRKPSTIPRLRRYSVLYPRSGLMKPCPESWYCASKNAANPSHGRETSCSPIRHYLSLSFLCYLMFCVQRQHSDVAHMHYNVLNRRMVNRKIGMYRKWLVVAKKAGVHGNSDYAP